VTTCIRIGSGLSTSLSFNKCYLRGSTTPLIVENCLVSTFTDLIMESCINGADIYRGNNISFINPYSENIPSVVSDNSILNFGINGVSETHPVGTCVIIGGNLAGANSGQTLNSSVFNVDSWSSLEVLGTKMARVGKIIKFTSNLKHFAIHGVSTQQVTSKTLPNCTSTSGIIDGATVSNYLIPTSFGLVHPANGAVYGFSMFDTFGTGKANMSIGTGGYTSVRFDCNGNVQLGGANVQPTDMYNVQVYGESSVTGTQSIGFNTLVYAKRVDGVTTLHQKTSNLNEGIIVTAHSGTTAQRPTQGRYVGKTYFDTSLNKPIWWNGSQWVDAMGTAV